MSYDPIEFDFGKGFALADPDLFPAPDMFAEYECETPPEPCGSHYGCEITVYARGRHPRILRLYKRIPIFDSADREYDSWHALYLVREQNGSMHAVYCTGGYRLAQIRRYGTVLQYPQELQPYFEDN